MHICMHTVKTWKTRGGGLGACSPMKFFLKFVSEIASEAILDRSRTAGGVTDGEIICREY